MSSEKSLTDESVDDQRTSTPEKAFERYVKPNAQMLSVVVVCSLMLWHIRALQQ